MSKIEGLDKLQNHLKSLSKKAKELDGEQSIPISELLTEGFVSEHTKFQTADQLFEASGFKVETQEDFANIPDAEWDKYIRANSSFEDWQAMLSAAAQVWTIKKLGL